MQWALDGVGVLRMVLRRGSKKARPRSTTTRDRNLQFWGAVSTGLFFDLLQWNFSVFSRFSVQFRKETAPKCGKICLIPGGENCVKSCHVSSCHGFFAPENQRKTEGQQLKGKIVS